MSEYTIMQTDIATADIELAMEQGKLSELTAKIAMDAIEQMARLARYTEMNRRVVQGK